ncbi:MAG: mechanosensitive ion channel family protein [Crenarchaeota archaeon]|nr:mechanosensitive ion channel family protein [Thermoproteota archaeon]
MDVVLAALVKFFETYERYIEATIALVLGVTLSYFVRKLLFKQLARGMPHHLANIITRGVFYTLLLIVILIAAGISGINLMGLAVAGSVAGVILGFALQPVITNLAAGMLIITEKILSPGDLVEIDGVRGWVVDVSLFSITLQRLDGVYVRYPNIKVLSSKVLNYSRSPVMRIDFVVSIAYKEDAEKAYEIIRKVVEAHPLVLKDPPPEIFVSNLGSSGVDILVRVWVPTQMWYEVKRDLLWRIKKAISDAGIEIPFTQIDVWFRNPIRVEKS